MSLSLLPQPRPGEGIKIWWCAPCSQQGANSFIDRLVWEPDKFVFIPVRMLNLPVRWCFWQTLLLLWVCLGMATVVRGDAAFPGAEGFGASSVGGAGGRKLVVTRLDDDPKKPREGSLRWALTQKGPRIVTFAVSGDIVLKREIRVERSFLTIDGSNAPEGGVCIRGGSLVFKDTNDIIIRHVRIRLGDETTLRANRSRDKDRPADSDGLDCITLFDSSRIIIDHCSLSWSCDELIGITRCRDVTVQWCILSEPLANPHLHPYGDAHAFGVNASASTLSIHHCLFANFAMRGPQFEANDMRKSNRYRVQMESVNNVVFNYERSGARYTTGVQNHQGEIKGKEFLFQFINNLFMDGDRSSAQIEAVTKHGYAPGTRVHEAGNLVKRRFGRLAPARIDIAAEGNVAAQISDKPLFTAPVPVLIEDPQAAAARVLAEAGCSKQRDSVDQRIVSEVRDGRYEKLVHSQNDVGGWPVLGGGKSKSE